MRRGGEKITVGYDLAPTMNLTLPGWHVSILRRFSAIRLKGFIVANQRTVITSVNVIYRFHPEIEARWHVKQGERLEIRFPDGMTVRMAISKKYLPALD